MNAQRIASATADAPVKASQRVSVNFENAPVRVVVKAIAVQAGLRSTYDETVIPQNARVTLHAKRISVGDAFQLALRGTGLAAQVEITGNVLIFPTVDPMSLGGIVGKVTNAKTKLPLRGIAIVLDDATQTTRTNDMGEYQFLRVTAGAHKVTVRAIGFSRQMKQVTTADDHMATLDFALESSVNTLDQVVVTATGAQRYRELGHVVTHLNADSLVRSAPITSLSELLTARVPGLQVMSSEAVAGGEVALRIRGTTTTSLDPQPIVIVDGVRYKNTNFTGNTSFPGAGEDSRPFNAAPRSPLNDLNVNDIETVEVVKGPSASTLYGPDAANGVIIITTKRGQIGQPQWHVYAYPDLSTLSGSAIGTSTTQKAYQGWGHIPGTSTLFVGQCDLLAQAGHLCVLDSVTVLPLPATQPQSSIVAKQRPQWHSGASVSGGVAQFLYFLSGNYDSQTGALQIPPAAETLIKQQLGDDAITNAIRDPNAQQTLALHGNISAQLTPTNSITAMVNYTQVTQRSMDLGVLWNQYLASTPFPGQDSASLQSTLNAATQSGTFLSTTEMQEKRWTAALTEGLQVRPWLGVNGRIGTDIVTSSDRGVRRAGSLDQNDQGAAGESNRTNVNRDVHLGTTAIGHADIWSFRTSAGIDYTYSNLDGLNALGSQLAPGSSDITTASSQSVSRVWNEVVSLGGYGEEVVGLRERLFLTASLRLDGSTSFGDAYTPRPFPKLGASWVVSDEPLFAALQHHGLDELRLRASFGAASRYPTTTMKLGTISPYQARVEGTQRTAFHRATLANPFLQPERSRETEYGADATLTSAVRLGLTWYDRRTNQELQQVNGPAAFPGEWTNVGDIASHGFEVTLDVKAFESDRASLDLTFMYANNVNKVVGLGASNGFMNAYGSYVVGYPVDAVFNQRVTGYVDSAGGSADHIIVPSEVVFSPQAEYQGVLAAPKTYSFTPALSLFGAHIRISALFDGQAGGVFVNSLNICSRRAYNCQAMFLQSTPLLEQATILGGANFISSSNFTRWRELSLTGDLPKSQTQMLHLSRASVSFQVRNLFLWTPSATASDPETVAQTTAVGTNGIGFSQPRTWTLRFDIAP